MSINKSQQGLENRLINDINQLKRDVREIKTKQPVGSDIISVVPAPSGVTPLTAGPFSVPYGTSLTLNVTTIPANEILTLWNFAFTIYIDAYDAEHQWPGGSSLTANIRELQMYNWLDWADSSDSSNSRVYKIRLSNRDPDLVTHTYYLAFKAYLPIGGA